MKKVVDLGKLVNEIEDYDDLDSLKEDLNGSGEMILRIGDFEYDEEFLDEPCFIFDEATTVDDIDDDEYYDRYKSKDAGYGIYLKEDLTVEYGYFIIDTFYNFKDTRYDDKVKNEICSLLDETDIWTTADVSTMNANDFHYKGNLEKIVDSIDYSEFAVCVAIDDDGFFESIDDELDSIEEALNNYGKVFLPFGDFSYSDYNKCFIFNIDSSYREDIYDIDDDDGYYDKYKFSLAGYGIYVDKELNVEYGYYTIQAPPSGHGPGYTTLHDFKDAIEGDKIKEKIYSLLDAEDIWDCDDASLEQDIKNNEVKELSESLDDLTVLLLAYDMYGGVLWVGESKEILLNSMLNHFSSTEIMLKSIGIRKNTRYTFFKTFNDWDDESVRKFAEYMDISPKLSREDIFKQLLRNYYIDELYEKLMSYKSV